MARSSVVAVLMLAAAVLLVAAAPQAAHALTCGQVVMSLRECIPYVRGQVTSVPAACCKGVKSLNALAKSTPDRQTACSCMKSQIATIKGIDMSKVAGVPGKCGVSVPYPISTSVDCSKVK
ncbi:hypothetical protein Cni_G29179 [Canna indica]|uniref:Non-specific lipid-transfer protein n=1 Tax=Canna indica TaxID=4628 RepID=A0AAQ3L4E1_9LILI|nr:hypothetical protein Cni_G29179 [Canna indica]